MKEDYEHFKSLPYHRLKRKLKQLKRVEKIISLKILMIEQIIDANSNHVQP